MKNLIQTIGQKALIASCPICFQPCSPSFQVCPPCQAKFSVLPDGGCPVCGQAIALISSEGPCSDCLTRPHAYDWHRSLYAYEEPLLSLIHGLKYGGHLHLIPFFGQALQAKFQRELAWADYLIPVPISLKKLGQRTFNQSLELARTLSRHSGTPYLKHSLIKKIETRSQAGLKQAARRDNLRDAFAYTGQALEGLKIILIDDVYTTGSTLHHCARVLKEAGVAKVGALTLALTPKRE